jgi:hypothetical protein
MALKGLLCPSHGTIPKAGSNPDCRDCRRLLDLPDKGAEVSKRGIRGDGKRGGLTPAVFADRLRRLKGLDTNGAATFCPGTTQNGRPCAETVLPGHFCRWHKPAGVPLPILQPLTAEVAA